MRASVITLLACTLLVASACEQNGGKSPASGSADTGEVAAIFNGEEIRLAQLDELARKSDLEAFQALYDARRRALDELIEQRLLSDAAASRGVGVEALLADEVDAKIPPVTEADIKAFYEQNAQSMGGQTLEQIAPRIEVFLADRARGELRGTLLERLLEQASLKVTLDPPRVEVIVAADEPSLGPATAAVTLVEYSDFQ